MADFEKIARESRSDEEALNELHEHGADAIQAIKSLIVGRGISHVDAKLKLIESPAWHVEAEKAKNLHHQVDAGLRECDEDDIDSD